MVLYIYIKHFDKVGNTTSFKLFYSSIKFNCNHSIVYVMRELVLVAADIANRDGK